MRRPGRRDANSWLAHAHRARCGVRETCSVPNPADTQVPSFILIGPALYRFADPHLLEGHSWAIDLASKRLGLY
ncbi:hypothetical protein AV530_001108 [Patagioenas fasciata monilis]|uniref:Uncharacterized protein n=1 Tax=Patagioenas fasciata monilis TaxID=372326 RepID=A0A1V4KT96_PATFA|nr:hypothetical protein AV530_001108 [Patagioenas fasciata monilis]